MEQQQAKTLDLGVRPRAARGESGVAFAAMVLAAVLILVGLILLVARLTAPHRPSGERVQVAAREKSLEKVYVGRAGDLGIVLRGPGAGAPGRAKGVAEGRALALEPGLIVARMDAFNFSDEPVPLVDGPLVVRIGGDELRPLPPKGETDPASPLHAALAGGDPAAVLGPRTARRIGLIAKEALFEEGLVASVRRGKIAEDVVLQARVVTERELAEFDRAPGRQALDRWLAAPKRPDSQR